MANPEYNLNSNFYKYGGMMMNSAGFTPEAIEASNEYEFDDEDILCPCYPKTGQTWLLTILYLIRHAEQLEKGEEIKPFHLQEWNFIESRLPDGSLQAVNMAKKPGPKAIKTHLPLEFFKERLDKKQKLKIIQVIRNPKDTLVSYFHFYRMNNSFAYSGTWEEFFQMFKNKDLCWGDLFTFTDDWYEYNRNREYSLILSYEEMKRDLKGNILKILKFVGTELPDATLDLILQKVSFSNMSKDPKLNITFIPGFIKESENFMRKGIVGDFKEYFTEDQDKYIEKRCKETNAKLDEIFSYE